MSSPEQDFALVLVRMIRSLKDDPAQMRNSIYELARIKLQREIWQIYPAIDPIELQQLMSALEAAIRSVETISAGEDEARRLMTAIQSNALPAIAAPKDFDEGSQTATSSVSQTTNSSIVIDPISKPKVSSRSNVRTTGEARGLFSLSKTPTNFAGTILRAGLVAAALVVAGCFILRGYFAMKISDSPVVVAAASSGHKISVRSGDTAHGRTAVEEERITPSARARDIAARDIPLPSDYGIYAISNGRIYELAALPGRVPDQRVFMSTTIGMPSATTLPNGKIFFVAYRRDLAMNAPDRVPVRIIAKITRAVKFSSAGAETTRLSEGTWTIRGNSHEMRVAPLSGNNEMLLIRPDGSDFVFPAGRYGLVIKGQAYDFSVAGPVTDAAQCLERVEAANGSFYAECRHP